MLKIKYILLLIFVSFSLSSCFYSKKIEGHYITPEKLEDLKLGMSKADVLTSLGSATFYSLFDENIIFYIYEVYTKRVSFSSKNISDAMVLTLTFDSNNNLSNIKISDLGKRKNIPLLKDSTKIILEKEKLKKSVKEYDVFKVD